MRKIVAVIVGSMLLAPAVAGAISDGMDDFRSRSREMHDLMVGYCRKHAAVMFPGRPQEALLGDPHWIRRACGKALNDRAIEFTEWKFSFNVEEFGNVTADTIGVWKPIPGEGPEMALVVGWQTSVAKRRKDSGKSTAEPTALALELGSGGWTVIWSYVDAGRRGWNLPPINVDPNGPLGGGRGQRIYSAWSRDVTAGFGRLLRHLKDVRGPGFPN